MRGCETLGIPPNARLDYFIEVLGDQPLDQEGGELCQSDDIPAAVANEDSMLDKRIDALLGSLESAVEDRQVVVVDSTKSRELQLNEDLLEVKIFARSIFVCFRFLSCPSLIIAMPHIGVVLLSND